jgi:hypothetical protein
MDISPESALCAQPQGGGLRSARAFEPASGRWQNLDSTREPQGSGEKNSCKINVPIHLTENFATKIEAVGLLPKAC